MIKEIEIDALGNDGEGVGRIDGMAVFVNGALPGERVEVAVTQVKKSYARAELKQVLRQSPDRIEPPCPVYTECGGCTLQHMTYERQLVYKTQKVVDALVRIGGLTEIEVSPCIGMDKPFFYRNKGRYAAGMSGGRVVLGFYARGSKRLIPASRCMIQCGEAGEVAEAVEGFINEIGGREILRYAVVRYGFTTEEMMVCLSFNGNRLGNKREKRLVEALPRVKSIIIGSGEEKAGRELSGDLHTIRGSGFITDYIGDMQYTISPRSFFQVNPAQTKLLYETALRFAGLEQGDIAIDAYCGIGSIALLMARHCKYVYGIECVVEAVEDARANAVCNGIENVEFFAGKTEDLLGKVCQEQPSVIVVDPPRHGCEREVLEAMARMKPRRIVYVSCDPATLARDLKLLSQRGYAVEQVQPVDMFAQTSHVESVVLLTRKDG